MLGKHKIHPARHWIAVQRRACREHLLRGQFPWDPFRLFLAYRFLLSNVFLAYLFVKLVLLINELMPIISVEPL